MPPTKLESSFTNGELFGEVRNWNRETKAGRTSESNGGYTYRPNRDSEMKAFIETLSGEYVLVGFSMNVHEVLNY